MIVRCSRILVAYPSANLAPECWNSLNVSDFLHAWLPSDPPCQPGEWWATCFIRIGSTKDAVGCTNVESKDPCGPGLDAVKSDIDPSIQPQVRYILAAIQQIRSLFSALANVTRQVDASDPVLVKLRSNPLNLTAKGDLSPGDYKTALSLGVPYIGARTTETNKFIGKTRISDALVSLAKRFLFALEESPYVTDKMYPTDGSGTTETNDIFNSGLFLLLTDIDAFIDFNKNGTWATNEDFNETLHADHGAGLSAATATLYTTVLLRLNGFNVTAGNTYSQADFHSVAGKDGACTVLDRGVGEICLAGVPGGPAYFWSGDTHRVYDFRTSRNLPKTPPKTTLLEIYNDTYADILTMFDGGYNCTLAVLFQSTLSDPG
ncbi:MAG: hypothetical protein L6R40_008243 [Gallowayella cf. fulva]|nr:MAG: hypothetical protein L6R40_008243 [Xanthomendoza cf. fulva]